MRFFRRHEDEADLTPDLRIVVGLGNPGSRFENTRHNLGKVVVEELASRLHVKLQGSKQRADIGRAQVEGSPVLLAVPVTFMNESGNPVSRLVRYYRVPNSHLLVIHDELDLPFGTLRIRPRGSAAGNNGLKSIIGELGTDDFPRLRIGIGRPAQSAVAHVLQPFSPTEMEGLPTIVETAVDAVLCWLTEGTTAAMNRFNRNVLPESTNHSPGN